MKKKFGVLVSFFLCLLWGQSQAAGMWIYEPLTPTSITMIKDGSAQVVYKITSNFYKSLILTMEPIAGVTTDGNCLSPNLLSSLKSCTLILNISAQNMHGNILGGPSLCQNQSTCICKNSATCIQPTGTAALNIKAP